MGAMREVKYASVGEQRRFSPSCKYSTEATLVDMLGSAEGHRTVRGQGLYLYLR